MKNAELVFLPAPLIGHFVSAVEVAKLLLERDKRLSITFLVMKSSLSTKIARSYNDSVIAACGRIRFIHLPEVELDQNLPSRFFISLIEAQKPHVKEEVSKLVIESESSPDSPRLAGFVLDMFSTPIIDVANEFGVPSYIFFTSAAAFLGTALYIQALHDEQKVDPTEFKNSDVELVMPCLASPFPAKVLPSPVLGKDLLPLCLRLFRRFREAKGIMVNTFYELESHAINSFSDGNYPPVYPVGPLLNLNGHEHDVVSDRKDTHRDIMQWLDQQPSSSVVYLCFGSMGSFGVEQVKEIACGLEQSGHRFLWSLRQPPPNGKMEAPSDYVTPAEVLPEGFLDRTSEIGKIIGWAPQVDILGHPSIGGFVSHCGWNSTLESIWFDVPMATWPMYAEQQFNAFLMIVEFGLAIEIQVNYRMDDCEVVRAAEIEKGIRGLMEFDIKKREKLKEISEKSRKALMKDGSSSTWLDRVIQDMIDNMP
ncbi:anthocyanidin 3-O-glucosyltransferase 6 isoform X2 [Populus alba x Populus x berolinensis]|nr:anthocyanidin 3-O-glucosyltransferase 6 isoform X2 [Populus alba x Populus x berolinensis]